MKENESQTISSRKREHVDLCVGENVVFRQKTSGFEQWEFIHNALPELDFDEISTKTVFVGKNISLPLMISSMTGGYESAERINRELAEVCQEFRIPMGVGSQRQALESSQFHASFSVARKSAPDIVLCANIGAFEVAQKETQEKIRQLIDLISADALIVHLNPLQELLQPEGTPKFRGVLAGIEYLARTIDIPIIVKEVGAGISAGVARKLLDVGVTVIDVAGAGGTSWAGVEILRNSCAESVKNLWEWGNSTAECLREIAPLKQKNNFKLISSGGINSGFDVAKSLALGADLAGAARILLKILLEHGQNAMKELIKTWQYQLQCVMFLTGSANISELQKAEMRKIIQS